MRYQAFLIFASAMSMLLGAVTAHAQAQQGLKIGDRVPQWLGVLNLQNAEAPEKNGKKDCFICQYGSKPVVLIFTPHASNQWLTKTIKDLDQEVQRTNKKLGVIVILVTKHTAQQREFEEQIKVNGFRYTSFGIDDGSAVVKYKFNASDKITVVMYRNLVVREVLSFDRKEYGELAMKKILSEVSRTFGLK